MFSFLNLNTNKAQQNFINKLWLINKNVPPITTAFKPCISQRISNQNPIINQTSSIGQTNLFSNNECDEFEYIIEEVI